MADLKQHIGDQLQAKLTQILRRHQDAVSDFDLSRPMFDVQSGLDSLDLAEVFAWVEQAYGIDPMQIREWDLPTWDAFAERVSREGRSTQTHS